MRGETSGLVLEKLKADLKDELVDLYVRVRQKCI